MNQFIKSQIFYLFLSLIHFINAGIESIDINYTPHKNTYDELYNDGILQYNKDNHRLAVEYFEKAIADYRHDREVKAQCWLKCETKYKKQPTKHLFSGQLSYLQFFIKMKSCSDRCKEVFLGLRGPVAREMKDIFEDRQPYSYIQFSYYKIGEFKKALEAAYTYYETHSNDLQMKKNIDIISTRLNIKSTAIKSMEELPHITLYKLGESSYDENNFKQCISSFEESLTLFYKELEKCHAVCEEQHEKHQSSFSASVFSHFKAIIDCRHSCRKSLTSIDGKTSVQHFVPYYFHYLQICYFQDGRVLDAAINAETYVMMIPNDPVMLENIGFYKRQKSIKGKIIAPRERAAKFYQEFVLEASLIRIIKGYSEPMFENDIQEDTVEEEIEAIYRSVSQEISALNALKGDLDSETSSYSIPSQYRDQNRWKNHPKLKSVSLLYEDKELNGTDRVAFDGLATQQQCMQLMKLVNKSAISGDGYQHNHDDAAHPFTKKELFKGVTIPTAVDSIAAGHTPFSDVDLYIDLSEQARLLTQEYFDLPVRLHFAFTHLVCRHALEDTLSDSDHLSHPVHSDNCVLDADGLGTCPKRSPAYTWRDYSGLLYLNDDFVGGDFIFANYKREIQARVRPKCGRFVAFRSNGVENLHGVLGVTKGVRCALPIWFTLSPDISEDSRPAAESKLKILKKKFKDGTLKVKIADEVNIRTTNEEL